MLLGARMLFASGKWKNPYVTDGLVAMWDGEWNAGPGKHTDDKTKLLELVNGLPITVYEADPSVSSISIDNDSIICSIAGNGSVNAKAVLYFESQEVANIISDNRTVTCECVVVPDLTFPSGYVSQDWGFSFDIGAENHLSSAAVRRWWQNSTMCGGFNGRLYRAMVQGVGSQSTSAMLWWQRKVYHAITVAKNSSISNAVFYIDGLEYPPDWYDFWSGGTSVGPVVHFGNFGGGNYGRPCRIYRIAIYSRALTAAEIAANYAIDQMRFNIS